MKKYELDTPALVLDIEKFDRNLTLMRDWALKAGKLLRPHAKTHKCSAVARAQLEKGGCAGICCAKLSEAEKMVECGITEILLTSPVAGKGKIARLIALLLAAPRLKVVTDSASNVRELSQAASAAGKVLDCLVDIDPEMGRTGVRPEEASGLAHFIAAQPGLRFAGIQCYTGNLQHIKDYSERRRQSQKWLTIAGEVVSSLRSSGIGCEIFTGTGTGTAAADLEMPLLTDIQVGSYCVMDAEYMQIGGPSDEKMFTEFIPAMTLMSTVISDNHDKFVTIDAGLKTLYYTPDTPPLLCRNGEILPGYSYGWFGDEHGQLFCGDSCAKPRSGEAVELILPHCDPTINLHDEIFVTRGDEVIDRWEIELRGCAR